MSRPEPWLVSYALLGLTQSGLVPVLMPLVAPHAAAAGLTFAAFSLSGIFAPILGGWADRTGRHRDLLIWGTFGAGLLFLFYGAVSGPPRIILAAGAGLGTMAATTAGKVIAIQGMSEDSWESRVALLQRFVSAGQVVGLVVAGLLAHSRPGTGFLFAGLALLAAGVLALASVPGREALASRALLPHRPGAAGWQELAAFLGVINRPMRLFLLVWLIAYAAMNGFAALFPVAMTRQFGMDPILPSGAYAIGVALSLAIYAPVGALTHRLGATGCWPPGLPRGLRFSGCYRCSDCSISARPPDGWCWPGLP